MQAWQSLRNLMVLKAKPRMGWDYGFQIIGIANTTPTAHSLKTRGRGVNSSIVRFLCRRGGINIINQLLT